MGLGKVEPNNGPSREAKRKLSPPRIINKAHLASSLQTIRTVHAKAHTPTDVSPKTLAVDNLDFRTRNKVIQAEPNHKASVKAKKALARARASQVIVVGATEREQSSFVVNAQMEKLNPISSGDQAIRGGEGKTRSSGDSDSRVASQLQLSSMTWPEEY